MGGRGTLVGRERELAVVDGFVRNEGAAGLLITGEAGLGKSALLASARELATECGHIVLEAAPGEGEEQFSSSVLIDLFRDVDLDQADLSGPVREGLDSILLRGPASSSGTDPQVVAVGIREVVSQLSADRHVVVCVDDIQWADQVSMDALAFAARRLAGRRVRFVVSRRSGFERTSLEAVLSRADLAYLEPSTLSLPDTAALLNTSLLLNLNPRVLRLVHDLARGNPLFTLEVGRVLLEQGVPELDGVLGLPSEMATMFGLRVRDLPTELRAVLLAVGLDPRLTESALTALVGLDTVDDAVRRQLITVTDDERVRAWHPLLAAAAREGATPARRRELHRLLAEVVEHQEDRLRHRALSSPEPDEELAASLAAMATDAGARGASGVALQLAELALTRTPSQAPTRVARVLDLASRLAHAEEAQRLTDFLLPEIHAMPHGPDRGAAWMTLLDGIVGSMSNLSRILQNAMDECGGDPELTGQVLDMQAQLAVGIEVTSIAEAMTLADRARALGAPGWGRDWCIVHAGGNPAGSDTPAHWNRAIWRGEMAEAERAVRGQLDRAEAEGHLMEVTLGQLRLGDLLVRCGRVEEARRSCAILDDADLTAKETTDEELLHAAIEARYGDVAATRAWADRGRAGAVEFGHVWIELQCDINEAMVALLAGEPDVAEPLLRRAFDHTVRAGWRNPGVFPCAPELVESLALLGRIDEADSVIDWLAEVSDEQDHPWGKAMTVRSRMLTELISGRITPSVASQGMHEVARDLADLGLAHDAGRAHLVIGSALRRKRQWGLARDHLIRAAEEFDRLGADGWSTSARSELERVGGRRPTAVGALSAAELDVANLAAEGLGNKQIARRLNVSVSTVEAHLTKVYAKVGIQSRSQLRDHLGG